VRALFTFVGGRGHLEPLAPVARAAARAGHTVAFACAPGMAAAVRASGFDALPLGAAAATGAPGSARTGPPDRLPLRPVDRAKEERDLRERFVRRAARDRAPHVIGLCEQWRPDVVVCDETDFGTMIACEHLGLPFASVIVIAAGGFLRADVIGEALDEVRAEHGLPPDPGLAMLSRHLVLAPLPPSYRDPLDPLPRNAHAFAPEPSRPTGPAPEWSTVRPGAPRIYLTLGTIFNLESGDLLARLVAGLRELDVNLLVTVGNDIDPAELGPQPAHVHVARYLPQAGVLPHCDLVVSHGGSGSVIGALAHGLPSVLVPLGADQPLNADELTPESTRAAATRLLTTPTYGARAHVLQREFATLPAPASSIPLLEALAGTRAPRRDLPFTRS
jgi:UDP:flavonoid glycosyltransferase YjiC (YdhE family)